MDKMPLVIVWVGRDKLIGHLDLQSIRYKSDLNRTVENHLLNHWDKGWIRLIDARAVLELTQITREGIGRVNTFLPIDVQAGPVGSIIVKPEAILVVEGNLLDKVTQALEMSERGELSARAQDMGLAVASGNTRIRNS